MKEFDLQKAKAGAPVCTRDGHKARIVCFDVQDDSYPILALITYRNGKEDSMFYTNQGKSDIESIDDTDLMMADIPTIRHEGWLNILYNNYGRDDVALGQIYNSKEVAEDYCPDDFHTVKIEWEDEE